MLLISLKLRSYNLDLNHAQFFVVGIFLHSELFNGELITPAFIIYLNLCQEHTPKSRKLSVATNFSCYNGLNWEFWSVIYDVKEIWSLYMKMQGHKETSEIQHNNICKYKYNKYWGRIELTCGKWWRTIPPNRPNLYWSPPFGLRLRFNTPLIQQPLVR